MSLLEVNVIKFWNYLIQMQEITDMQKQFVESCQPVQQDDPNQVANVLDKLFDSLIEK